MRYRIEIRIPTVSIRGKDVLKLLVNETVSAFGYKIFLKSVQSCASRIFEMDFGLFCVSLCLRSRYDLVSNM